MSLARIYENGEDEVAINLEASLKWYSLAAT